MRRKKRCRKDIAILKQLKQVVGEMKNKDLEVKAYQAAYYCFYLLVFISLICSFILLLSR